MKVVFDTDVIIDFLTGRKALRDIYLHSRRAPLYLLCCGIPFLKYFNALCCPCSTLFETKWVSLKHDGKIVFWRILPQH